MKTIYNAPIEEQGRMNRDRVSEKWSEKYPNAMRRWERDWDVITPIFKFSADVRTVIYTTNAIESLNSTYRKLNRQRSVFPSGQALLKALYLATFEATKNGVCRSGTGARSTVNWQSCTKIVFQNKKTASNGRSNPPAVDMHSSISYILSNRQTAKNLKF